MATVKREEIVDEDNVAYVDEIEIKIEIKREEGERIEREEEIRRREERTGFEAVKEERCGLCVKASEEKLMLEERVKPVEAELRETKAELRETKMEVVTLREGLDDDDGGGTEEEGIEDEVVVVPAASAPAEPRVRRLSRKRKEMDKAATLVEEQPRNVKKVKRTLSKVNMGAGFAWTADEDSALVEAVDKYGLDFGRIKEEAGARLSDRTVDALRNHFRRSHPDKYGELIDANSFRWTKKEDETLKKRRKKHGADWEKILKTENEVL
ncbi:hypothetical protein TL16_g03804 [Triparma laevis f. inornata]|uniref:Myb-like domain-containing protein n=1 Tax=Triparma laevis f. inornata TaxID=1714386 RepID=A0A9W7E3E0_9STRA|nr:hypothetical protein TL16_g03804 [Triparma laevis f. inornata]